jgi:hypothetical protein
MITKKLTRKLHESLKLIIQEYMNLNDWTSQKDHTVHDIWLRLAYKREWYPDLKQDQIRILHKEKQDYYWLSEYSDPYTIKQFRQNAQYIDRDIEKWQSDIRKTIKYRLSSKIQ